MKIKVYGEGTRDIGRDGKEGHRGAVCVLIERLLGEREWVEVHGLRLPTLHRRGGIALKVQLAIEAAHLRGDDGVAIVIDNDGAQPAERRGALQQGADLAEVPIPRALGLAIQEEEAWLLADEKVLMEALDLSGPVQTQSDPEEIENPKEALHALAGRKVRGADLERIASVLDIERVERRCPKGFGKFAQDVRRDLGPVVQGERSG